MFGKQVKKLRKYFELTQTEFAEAIGKGMRTVQNWEKGDNIPSRSVTTHICKTFGINESWLMFGSGEMFYEESSNRNKTNIHTGDFGISINSARQINYHGSGAISEKITGDLKVFVDLAEKYATPTMIKSWTKKLEKIKKLHEEE